jgi:hypothetical protein
MVEMRKVKPTVLRQLRGGRSRGCRDGRDEEGGTGGVETAEREWSRRCWDGYDEGGVEGGDG